MSHKFVSYMNLWDFRFSQWCCWRCKSAGMLCYHCTIILWHFKGTMILQDVGDYLLNDTVSHCGRLATSYMNFLWVQTSSGFELQHILDDQHCDNCSDPDSGGVLSSSIGEWHGRVHFVDKELWLMTISSIVLSIMYLWLLMNNTIRWM
jgi:hypothetical protein